MALLKTWCLLPLAALLLLSIVPTAAEVVKLMSNCSEFFLNGTPPHVPGILEGGKILDQNRYKPICQTLNDTRTFVTLYDTENKIPVFSAYRYRGNVNKHKQTWMIEPQLEDEHDDKNMDRESLKKNYTHQATDNDYKNSRDYDRGHLFPSSYAFSDSDQESTYTMTNAVPQEIKFNQKRWSRMESCVKCVLNEFCSGSSAVEAYLVTGAQPGNNTLNRVNIPSILWSAFCCYSHREDKWFTSAHWGENVPDPDETKYPQTTTLGDLQIELRSFEAFPGSKCPLDTHFTQLYSKLERKKDCNCP